MFSSNANHSEPDAERSARWTSEPDRDHRPTPDPAGFSRFTDSVYPTLLSDPPSLQRRFTALSLFFPRPLGYGRTKNKLRPRATRTVRKRINNTRGHSSRQLALVTSRRHVTAEEFPGVIRFTDELLNQSATFDRAGKLTCWLGVDWPIT